MAVNVLSSRERLTRLFRGQATDRIPIWLLAPYHRLSCYVDIYHLDCYKKIVEYIDRYCDTFDRRHFDTGFCFSGNPEIVREAVEEKADGGMVRHDRITYKDFSVTKTISTGSSGTKVKFFVDDIAQLEKILELPWKPVEPELTGFFAEKEELGDKGLMMVDVGDPLQPLYQLMSAEDFSVFSLTEYDRLLEFTDEMYRRVSRLYKYLLERDAGDVFFIVGAEFAGPPLVSPDKFNEMSARYVKGICDLIREYGKFSIVHYHGNLFKVLQGMKEINPDGLHTVEAPPIGDCTLTQAREVLGREMTLIGNIQYDDLVHRDREEIGEMVRTAIMEGRTGRFILSPTAGPYEENISEKTAENYLAFIEAGVRYGRV